MPNRRKVLIGLGGSIAIAGCTGETDEEEPEEEEPEEEEETDTSDSQPEEEDESEDESEEEEPPVEEPENVPQYTVESIDDISFNGTVRYDYDIAANGDLPEYSKEDLMRISKELILETISDQSVNALSFTFWRGDQEIGAEQAHAVIEWAPDGRWEEAKEVDTGDYSQHEFQTRGVTYIQAVEINSPESVKLMEKFTISSIVVNKGITSGSISIRYRNGDVYEGSEITLDPGEQAQLSSPPIQIEKYTRTGTKSISIEDSIGSIHIGDVSVEITPLEIGDSYSHPEYDWDISLVDIEIDGRVVYAEIEGDRGETESVFLPNAFDFYLIEGDNEHDGMGTLNNASGTVEFYPGDTLSVDDIQIKYMDAGSRISSDGVAVWNV